MPHRPIRLIRSDGKSIYSDSGSDWDGTSDSGSIKQKASQAARSLQPPEVKQKQLYIYLFILRREVVRLPQILYSCFFQQMKIEVMSLLSCPVQVGRHLPF